MIRALSFAIGYARQRAHCQYFGHYPLTGRLGGRISLLKCFTCHQVFWHRRPQR